MLESEKPVTVVKNIRNVLFISIAIFSFVYLHCACAHRYSHPDNCDFCHFFFGVFIRMKPNLSIQLHAYLVTLSLCGGGSFCLLKVWNSRSTCVRVKSRPASTAVDDVHQFVFDVTGYRINWQPWWMLYSTTPLWHKALLP